ncbi:retrovirus-related pol polyprotein from transposon TNT 1-94 [Tanacetum coccineum]
MEGWKPKSLKNKSFANIQELFEKAMKRVNTFVNYRTGLMEESPKKAETELKENLKKAEADLVEGSSKRAGTELEQVVTKKQKVMMEDLETLWKLVKAKHGSTRPEEGYERVLWGDLKIYMLVEKKYYLTPATITDMLNKKLQWRIFGIKRLLDDLRVTAAQVCVTAAKLMLSKLFYGTVKFGNDHIAKIIGYGDYQMGNVTISRVYYMEELGQNLFFVGQFCDSDLEVAFRKHTCFIRDLEELLHDRKPHLSYLHVFGALCYPTNDGEDLGKLILKADIGIFIVLDVSTGSPSSTSVDQDAPSPSASQTPQASPSHVIPPSAEEVDHDIKVAHMDNNPQFVNQPPDHINKWTKDHLIDNIEAMQEELNKFERLKVWDLVPRLERVMIITLKWIYKVKLDERHQGLGMICSHHFYSPRSSLKESLILHCSSGEKAKTSYCRPNLQFVVFLCAQYQEKPTKKHLHAVKRIFRYLRGTINMGLWYSKDSCIALTAFTDADHAGCQDTRRSTSRSMQLLGDRLLADIFTKALGRERLDFLINKLGMRKTQQVIARDEKWVPSTERVKIIPTNVRLETTVHQKEETFQVIIDVIKNSTCFKALTIFEEVPAIFMQQFWYTIKKVKDSESYEFLLANKKCIVPYVVRQVVIDSSLRVCLFQQDEKDFSQKPSTSSMDNSKRIDDSTENYSLFEVNYDGMFDERPLRVHSIFHVSNLKKCLSDEPLAIPLDEIHTDDKLHFVEEPVEIMDREVKRLKQSRILIIKVRWNSRRGPEFT